MDSRESTNGGKENQRRRPGRRDILFQLRITRNLTERARVGLKEAPDEVGPCLDAIALYVRGLIEALDP
jgi:hypothetical protein